MVGLFDKPINLVDANDINELVSSSWPESYTLEYKRSLPHKAGGVDPWDQGKAEIGEYARNEILAEVVALANSDGGFVILGVGETKEKPPRAAAVVAQKQVRELARRLEDQARACIDPPISTLAVHPIETSGSDGVVILKTGASRLAPHRVSTTRDCFARRGPSTVKMTMREIQEMSVNSAHRTDDLQKVFGKFNSEFLNWPKADEVVAYRATAAPLDRVPDASRLWDASRRFSTSLKNFKATVGPNEYDLVIAAGPLEQRPILRGISAEVETGSGRLLIQHYQSGAINLCFAVKGTPNTGSAQERSWFYHGWLLGGVANVLLMVLEHRQRIGYGDVEYGIEIELFRDPRSNFVVPSYIGLAGGRYGMGGFPIPETRIMLPIISVGGLQEFDTVINAIDTDIYDALGVRQASEPIVVAW